MMLQMDASPHKATPLVATPFEERGAIFSPDGRWIAYVSNKSGQNDIYARPYPEPGPEVTISVGGGQASQTVLNVVVNWVEELKRRAPTK